ncbi:hypothetical protein AURDEDRAFT_110110 [Auricularia subglabra TFB-10046 SS5]|nr:hypothetical protein AURDEDRAFT_110110 [Auricularia subglabra TFB-10046 SS5]
MPNFLSLSRFAKQGDSPRQRTISDSGYGRSAPSLTVTDSSEGEDSGYMRSITRKSSAAADPALSKKPMDRHALSNYYQRRSLTEDDAAYIDDMPTPQPRSATFQEQLPPAVSERLAAQQQAAQPYAVANRSPLAKELPLSGAERVKQEYAADETRKRTASEPALPTSTSVSTTASADSNATDDSMLQDDFRPPLPASASSSTNSNKREKGKSPWRRGSAVRGGPDPAGGIAGALAASGMAIAHPASTGQLVPPMPQIRRTPSQVSVLSTSSGGGGAETNGRRESNAEAGQPRGRHFQAQLHAPRASETDISLSGSEDDRLIDEDAMPVTGFAVASSKRNADFHDLFPQIAADDYLIEDYGCALQREILVQGRIYISENHLCFHANIFGWVSNEIIPFSEITALEKRMTALIIPNAIQVTTLHKMYTFASFMGRDTAFEVMHNIWRLVRPPGVESPLRTSLDESNLSLAVGAAIGGASALGIKKVTTCSCAENKQHYPIICLDTVFPGTPDKIYNLMFASGFVKDFMRDDQKLIDIQISDWQPVSAGSTLLTRNMSYIKPLTGSFGPKQAKCELRDETIHFDAEKYITMLTTTRTPDVPSGTAFSVKSRTCLTWAGACATRVVVTSTVEWTGSSFIKGLIERSAMDGQKQYNADLEPAMRKYIDDHRGEFVPEGMEALAESEAEVIVASPASASTIAPPALPGSQERDERWLQWALDTFRGASKVAQQSFSGAMELLWDVPDTRAILLVVIVILVVTNIFSLLAVSRNSTHPTTRTGPRERADVSDALRTILEEMRKAAATTAVPTSTASEALPPMPTDWRAESAAIQQALDEIEQRVQRLRNLAKSRDEL